MAAAFGENHTSTRFLIKCLDFLLFYRHPERVEEICVNLHREADPKKKKDRPTLIGCVTISTDHLSTGRHPIEKWYFYE